MAAKVHLDFCSGLTTTENGSPTTWAEWIKPAGVYWIDGVVAGNQSTVGSFCIMGSAAPRVSNGSCYGTTGNSGSTAASFIAAAYYNQIGIRRSTYSLGSEIWATFDLGAGFGYSTTSGTQTTDYRLAIFRWGDVQIHVKSFNLVVTTYTAVFSIRNNGAEVTTVSVPGLTPSGTTAWIFFKVHVKLDGASGLIEVVANGVSQAATYTAQNTVTTQALASTGTTQTADHIYFGSGYNAVVTSNFLQIMPIQNVCIDDAAFPTGRPSAIRWLMGTTSTDTNFVATGTSPTNLPNALVISSDAKAIRGTGAGAVTLIDMATLSTTGMDANYIGIILCVKKPATRDFAAVRTLQVGISISGVTTMTSAKTLLISAPTLPPNLDYTTYNSDQIFTAGITTTNINNVKPRLLVG